MSRQVNLREFQQYLNQRFAAAEGQPLANSLLAFEAGASRWLISLHDAGGIEPCPTLYSVPLTKPSLLGVANVRGKVYAVTDWSIFLGGFPTPRDANARLLLLGQKHKHNAALLISRALGLCKSSDYTVQAAPKEYSAWCEHAFTDKHGELWYLLSVPKLLLAPTFLHVGS